MHLWRAQSCSGRASFCKIGESRQARPIFVADYSDPGASVQHSKDCRNSFEPELDPFLEFVLGMGHVTPGFPGTTYPVAFLAVSRDPKRRVGCSLWRDQGLGFRVEGSGLWGGSSSNAFTCERSTQ